MADYDEGLAVDLGGELAGFALRLEVLLLEIGAHRFEARLVFAGRAQRLAAREEEIAGKAVFHTDCLAHLADLADAVEQNDFHCRYSFWTSMVQVLRGGMRLAATRARMWN